jgi:hypothetical protein
LVYLKLCGNLPLSSTGIPYTDLPGTQSKPARSPCAEPGDPCHQKSSTVVGPGLLEGDTGFTQQAPAAAGRPATGPATSRIPGRGP